MKGEEQGMALEKLKLREEAAFCALKGGSIATDLEGQLVAASALIQCLSCKSREREASH